MPGLLRRLKRAIFGEKYRCPKCMGWGINCFTCDEEGVPIIEDMAVHAFGIVEIRTCDLDKCEICKGSGYLEEPYSIEEEEKITCLACGRPMGNVRMTPIIDSPIRPAPE